MKLVREFFEEMKFAEVVDESNPTAKQLYMQGITIQMELKNGNGRWYRKTATSEAVNRHLQTEMCRGRCVGELNHPDTKAAEIDPEKISHRFVEAKEDGNNIWTKALVLDTPKGKIVKELHAGGVQLGISSRGLAEMSKKDNIQYIDKYHVVTLGDIVWDPSAPNAFVEGVLEGKDWVWNAGKLVECDLSESLDDWKNRFKKVSKAEYNKVVLEAFQSYFRILGK